MYDKEKNRKLVNCFDNIENVNLQVRKKKEREKKRKTLSFVYSLASVIAG